MKRLLRAFGVVVCVLAAVDTYLARRSVPYRSVEAALFLQALALWAAFTAAALAPAWLTLRALARRRRARTPTAGVESASAAGCVLLAWAGMPVILHAALDGFTSAGQDVSHLKSVVPWLVAAAVGAAFGALAWLAARALARVPGRAVLLVLVPAALAVGLFLPRRESAPKLARVGDATGKPNLLLMVWDTCRADHTEPYGYARDTTPNLARLAAESMVFEQARSATIFTFTSHLTMLTGVMPSVHGARLLRSRYDPRKSSTIAQILRENGYRTGAFVGTDVLAGRTGMRHGFERYSDAVDPPVCDTYGWKLVHDLQSVLAMRFKAFRHNGLPHWIQDFQRPADQVLADARAWIDDGDPRPWFAMINLYDAHWPYLPGPEARDALVRAYNGAFDGYLFRSDAYVPGTLPDAGDTTHLKDLYDAELRQLDRDVDRFLRGLDLERTGVLITADHGEAFGEAGTWMHANLFEPQLSVPFLLRLPGATRRGRVPTRVAGVDVAPTLLGLAGVPAPEILQGVDLTREVPDPARVILVEDSDNVDPNFVRLALYRGRWKVVRHGIPGEYVYLLYDLLNDPVGERDVSPEHPDVKAELVALLVAIRGDADARMGAEKLDPGAGAAGLHALGYMDAKGPKGGG
jgi:arylsulfatase A-like enzyme